MPIFKLREAVDRAVVEFKKKLKPTDQVGQRRRQKLLEEVEKLHPAAQSQFLDLAERQVKRQRLSIEERIALKTHEETVRLMLALKAQSEKR